MMHALTSRERELLAQICDNHYRGHVSTLLPHDFATASALMELGLVHSYHSTVCRIWHPTQAGIDEDRSRDAVAGR
jgi:hypothetical protein